MRVEVEVEAVAASKNRKELELRTHPTINLKLLDQHRFLERDSLRPGRGRSESPDGFVECFACNEGLHFSSPLSFI